MTGEAIAQSMKPMHDRSNGLGGGFAAYGIYPDFKDEFAFHIFYDNHSCRAACEAYLKEKFGDTEVSRALKGDKNDIKVNALFYPQINEFRGDKNIQLVIAGLV